jgi:two-component system NtrC family sensor kinase
MDEIPKRVDKLIPSRKMVGDFLALSHGILSLASRDMQRMDFLKEISQIIGNFSGCDAVEFCVEQYETQYFWRAVLVPEESYSYKLMPRIRCDIGDNLIQVATDLEHPSFCISLLRKQLDPWLPFVTKNGSLWTGDAENPMVFKESCEKSYNLKFHMGVGFKSIILIPFEISDSDWGVMQLKSKASYHFTESEVQFFEGIAQTLGLTIAYRRMRRDCGERVKELTCLYGVAQIASQYENPLGDVLQEIIELLPPAMQFPELAMARITLDSSTFQTLNFSESIYKKAVKLVIKDEERGLLEVAYREGDSWFVADPFLKEEEHLLETMAKDVSLVIEERESVQFKTKLQEQLRHADRLATIGQLTAGVAHELNEPLGSILGFTQLIQSDQNISPQSKEDLEKIIKASMHAREIVRKLMLFSRQIPTKMSEININSIVDEGLYLLKSRIEKEGIELIADLASDMPPITGDQSQIHQILVNLTVNAIQAMSQGGKLKIQTKYDKDNVFLIVEDSGNGIDEEAMKQIFLPFFTTKDIGEGTGLGLSVVWGIVTSHGGIIQVESKIGEGSRFTVRLPIRRGKKET